MKSPDTILGHQKQSPETKGNVPLSSIPQRSSSTGNALANPLRPSPPAPDFDTSMQLTQAEVLAQNTHVRASPSSNRPNILQTASGPYDPDSVLTKLHPAIRAQYAAMLQRKQGQSPQQTPEQLRSQPQTQQSPHSTASNGISSPVQPTYENHAQHVPHAQVPYQLSQQSYATGQNISQTPLSHNGSLPMVQHMQQTSSGDSQGEVDGNHQDTATRVRSQTPQDRIKRDSPSTSQQFETTTPPQIRQVPHKQTPVPPPRPWEQLQRTTPTKTMPPPAQVQPLTTTPNGAPVSSQSAYNQGPQPTNVSGPFWQTHPQTMPNSNSLSPQPPFDPFQFINFQ